MKKLILVLTILVTLPSFAHDICQPKDLSIKSVPGQPEKSEIPSEMKDKIQKAVASLLLLDSKAVHGYGSGFAVKNELGQTVWLTAAHVGESFKTGETELSLIPATQPFVVLNADGETGHLDAPKLAGRVARDAYSEDDSNPWSLQNGTDVAQIEDRGVTMADPEWRNKVQPLTVRDLEKEPLILNEQLFLAGTNWGDLRTFSCANRGLLEDAFKLKTTMNVSAKCTFPISNDGQKLPLLGGISGGVMVDGQGRAVSVFSGYLQMKNNRDLVWIMSTPLYRNPSKPSHFQTHPELAQDSKGLCMPCVGIEKEVNVEDPNKEVQRCVLSMENKRLKFGPEKKD